MRFLHRALRALGRGRVLAAAVAAVHHSLVGCSEPVTPTETTVRDSAGVEIVEIPVPVLEGLPLFRSADTPRTHIGVREGPEELILDRVTDATLLSDGRIAVLTATDRALRLFSMEGEFIGSTGGRGEGPGEFVVPTLVSEVGGDSIAVFDLRPGRLTWLDLEGRLLGTEQMRLTALNPRILGIFRDGSVLVEDDRYSAPEGEMGELEMTLLRYSGRTPAGDSVGRFPLRRMGNFAEIGLIGPVFDPRTWATTSSDRFWVGTGREPEILEHTSDGTLLRLIRWEVADRSIPREEVDLYWERRIEDTSERFRPRIRRMAEITDVADRFPAHDRILASVEGGLWVQTYRRPSDEGDDRWLVLDREGMPERYVETPRSFLLLEAAEDHILGIFRDELDVQYIRLYDLVPE